LRTVEGRPCYSLAVRDALLVPSALALTLTVAAGCGVPLEEVDALRKDVSRLRGEVREARKEAGRARAEVAALNLKAEVHAFLQNDGALKGEGRFPALGDRVRSESRAITFKLPAGAARRMAFKMGYRLRIDFVAGSGAAEEIGNRLEVFTRNESFSPLNMQPNEYGAYVLEEGQALLLATSAPAGWGDADEDSGRRRRKKKRRRARLDASEIQMRYLPVAGADSRRVAYVRVIFLGPNERQAAQAESAEEPEDNDDDDAEEEPAAAPEGDTAAEDSDDDAGDGDDGGYDFSDED